MMPRKKQQVVNTKNYDWKITVIKGLKMLAIYGLSFLIFYGMNYKPEVMGLTLGTLFTMLLNYLKQGTNIDLFKKI